MTTSPGLVLEMQGIRKHYAALRPLRIEALSIAPAERVAIAGFDAAAAELVVSLVTGAALPDEGQIHVLGQATSDLNADQWLASLDRFGIVSPRAVLLEGAMLEQNLAMPFTLEIDPVPPEVVSRVRALATRCGLDWEQWRAVAAANLPPEARARAHLARAIALDPMLLLMEHPTASLPASSRRAFGVDVARVADERRLATLALTNDDEFGAIMADRHLRLDGATGRLTAAHKRRWFGSR